ncbi:alpha/beta fold hydrolase [Amycolatopsis sp. DG1A-15b]|uniref:thioesterase II family protein n=1 Tax=Amycolatopsis sp. DG1A-15b TaxID=3052846 RepID=UPI00255C1A4A|nr:alpha/beta fold hydrolase [Amycolatopsis sp. DG1A-15b]WIX91745.1 alpha/beta fold hydrolase [Amycolatopsis sp. DG1A-15b]
MRANEIDTTPYLPFPPSGGAALRLLCFPHAGGAASVFKGWRGMFGPGIDVLPVQLPGREGRIRDELPKDMASLVDELEVHLEEVFDEPFACYGHSMGALVAYHLALRLAVRGRPVPRLLMVGACKAPHLGNRLVAAHDASDAELKQAVLDLGGLSPLLLGYPDWLSAALGLVRRDLALCATQRPDGPAPCPVRAFHGADDPLVSEGDMAAWARYSAPGFALHRVPGGHFFVHEPALVAQFASGSL